MVSNGAAPLACDHCIVLSEREHGLNNNGAHPVEMLGHVSSRHMSSQRIVPSTNDSFWLSSVWSHGTAKLVQ